MNSSISRKQWTYAVLSVVLGCLLVFAAYYYVVYPVGVEVTSKQNELKGEENILAALEKETTIKNEITVESTVDLQKQLPVKPFVQQLIVDLNKAEVLSKSFIKSVSVAESDVTMVASADTESFSAVRSVENEGNLTNATSGTTDETNSNNENSTVQNGVSSPDGLKKVTLSLAVQSPSYIEFEKFLSSLESMKRIMTIENVAIAGDEEITNVEQKLSIMEYTVTLDAYFAPVLATLQKDLPTVDLGSAAKKKNPFYSSPTDSETNEEGQEE